MDHIFVILIIMLVTGVLGGIISYFMNDNKDTPLFFSNKFNTEFVKSIVLGMGAVILVPIFLKMISSDLIEKSKTDNYELLVFTGICLIASITSRKFIQKISEKFQEQVLEPLMSKSAERETSNSDEPDSLEVRKIGKVGINIETSPEVKLNIIDKMKKSDYAYRTISGISDDAGLTREETKKYIALMIRDGLIGQYDLDKSAKFYLTKKGRAFL